MSPEECSVCYHPYALMIALFDDSKSIQVTSTSKTHFSAIASSFDEVCRGYGREVKEFATAFGRDSSFQDELFAPISYFALGHPDAVSLVLLDDTDPFLDFTTRQELPMEQVCLAFAPKLADLGIECSNSVGLVEPGATPNELTPPVIEAHSLFSNACRLEYDTHGFCTTRYPVLVVTRLKLSGITVLPNGVRLQNQVYRAMARSVSAMQSKLVAHCQSSGSPEIGMTIADVENTKIAFLDGQGSEEIVTVTVTTNASVSAAYLKALRSVTYEDVAHSSESSAETIDVSKCHKKVAQLAGANLANGAFNCFRSNHVVSASYSTLSIDFEEYNNPTGAISGYVEAYGKLEINAGHMPDVEHNLDAALGEEWPKSTVVNIDRTDIHRLVPGRFDYDFSLAWERDASVSMIPLASAIDRVKHLQNQFIKANGGRIEESGLYDMSTSIVCPLPRDVDGSPLLTNVRRSEHLPILAAFDKLQEHILGQFGCLSQERLLDAMRTIRVPKQLGRTVLHLYQNFSAWIANPMSFEVVIDLLDVLEVLHSIVTTDLVAEYRDGPNTFIEVKPIEELGKTLETLRDAMSQRASVYPTMELQDWSVDIRGGLNQLVAGSDAALKCAVGICKWYERQHAPIQGDAIPPIASVAKFTFLPRTLCRHIRISSLQSRQIAEFEMSITHILNPSGYIDYIHEAAHLLWERMLLRKRQLDRRLANMARSLGPMFVERSEEVFAECITHCFVFGEDVSLFRKSHMVRFNEDPESRSDSNSAVIEKSLETLVRIFIASEPHLHDCDSQGGSNAWHRLRNDARDAKAPSKMENRFVQFVFTYARLCASADSLLDEFSVVIEQRAREKFRNVVMRSPEIWGDLWAEAFSIWKQYGNDSYPWSNAAAHKKLRSRMRAMFKCGQVVPVSQILKASYSTQPDELVIVCEAIYAYQQSILESVDGDAHVKRGSDGKIGLTSSKRAAFLLDPAYSRPFCCDAGARRARLSTEIVFLKLMWDVSAILRARRLSRLCDQTLQVPRG